jgi:lipoprotein-anchoring transpeptidase ErfK/SrfK
LNRGLQAVLLVAIGTTGALLAAGPSAASAKRHAVPSGVRIAGVRVGGLAPTAAASAVRAAFDRPLPVLLDGKQVDLHPARLARAYIEPAVGRASAASAGTNIRLVVAVRGAAVRAAVAALSRRVDRAAHDAQLRLVAGKPRISPEVDGTTLDQSGLVERVVRALSANVRLPLPVHARTVPARVTARSLGPTVLINRETNRLTLFKADNQVWRVFSVATGQSIYPTPAGRFHIVVKWVDPWWYPPTQDAWAAGLSPVPPGPNNPLGTRWMGLSAPGIGIHGTDEPSSIGWNASHGCIRMQVVDSEWLFGHVRIGTTVFIV